MQLTSATGLVRLKLTAVLTTQRILYFLRLPFLTGSSVANVSWESIVPAALQTCLARKQQCFLSSSQGKRNCPECHSCDCLLNTERSSVAIG